MQPPTTPTLPTADVPAQGGVLGFLLDFHNRTILFRVGDWIVTTYAVLAGTAFAVGVSIGLWFTAMTGQDVEYMARFYLFVMAPMVLVGLRSFSILLEWRELFHRPLATIIKPGYMLHGGILGGTLALAWLAYRSDTSVLLLLDAGALALPLGEAIARLGCYVYGCCWGRPTEGPIGVRYTSPHSKVVRCAPHLHGVKIHPAQLYALVIYLAMFVAFYALLPYRLFDGMLLGIFFVAHSLVRLSLEHFREDDRGRLFGPFTHTQFYATVMALGGVAALVVGANSGQLTVADPSIRWIHVVEQWHLSAWIGLFGLVFGLTYGVHYKKVGQWISSPAPRPAPEPQP
jgi:phosphatidylglycerol:prolipoprotein diacylglycerol transferase